MLVPAATALIHFGQLQTFPLPSLPPQVQKSAAHYTEAAQDEITLCSQIRDGDPLDDRCCVRMYDSFEHGGPHGRHTCMVFEVLGENLLALIKRYDYRGIPLPIVRNLSRQMLIGLDYIHRWGRGAIQVGHWARLHSQTVGEQHRWGSNRPRRHSQAGEQCKGGASGRLRGSDTGLHSHPGE